MSTLKRAARRMLRPLFSPILRRIDETRHLAVELDRALPLVRNSIESQNAELRASARHRTELRADLDRFHADLVRVQQQIDALRDEFALALLAGVPVSPAATGGGLKLAFGGDAQSTPEHALVDLAGLRGDGLAAGVRALPYAESTAAEVRAVGILDHFSPAELRDVLLPYWRGLLMPGARLVAAGLPAASLEGLLRLLEETGYGSIETVSRWRDGALDVVEVRAGAAPDRVAAALEGRSRNSEVHAR